MVRSFVLSAFALSAFALSAVVNASPTPVLVDEGVPALFYAASRYNDAPYYGNGLNPTYIDEEELHPGTPVQPGTVLVHPPKPLLPPHIQQQLNAVRRPKPRGTPVGNNYQFIPRPQQTVLAIEEPYTVYKPVKPFARVNLDSNGFVYPHADTYGPATYVQNKVRPVVTPITVHRLRGGYCNNLGACY